MKTVTQETKTKLHDTHVKLAQDPARLEFLRKIAQDPANKEKRALAMKKKWQEPEFKAKMKAAAEARAKAKAEAAPVDEAAVERTEARITEGLTKTAEALGTVEAPAPVKKKRVVTDEQKAKYAAKRAAAKS